MTAFCLVPDGFDGFVFNPSKIHAVLDGILTGLTGLTGFFLNTRTHTYIEKKKLQTSRQTRQPRQRKTKNAHPHGEQSADGFAQIRKTTRQTRHTQQKRSV